MSKEFNIYSFDTYTVLWIILLYLSFKCLTTISAYLTSVLFIFIPIVKVYNFLFLSYSYNNIDEIAQIKDESTPPDNKHPKSLSVNNLFLTHLINKYHIKNKNFNLD